MWRKRQTPEMLGGKLNGISALPVQCEDGGQQWLPLSGSEARLMGLAIH